LKQHQFNKETVVQAVGMTKHGASSPCGWRRRPPHMERTCEYIEWEVADSRQGV